IAEKIIQTSLKSSGEIIKRMIVSATDKLKKTEWVKIYIDRFGYEKLLEVDSVLAAELSYLSDNIKIIVMDKEEIGSCIVEVPEEIIDLSVSTQLENIKDIINNARLQ
ncbi:MAG TPA: flagellar biosynthesis/type III secretory pathway protein, partial [Lachnospiraceae bacterium]|nr:flagellar biosynthesis/type III secretory pathway protein [Lachnospiraceae bacterium]